MITAAFEITAGPFPEGSIEVGDILRTKTGKIAKVYEVLPPVDRQVTVRARAK